MAVSFNSIKTHGKADVFRFDPRDLVNRFAAFTGRSDRDPARIEAMAQSLLRNGQEQAFLYRKGFDGDPIPVSGHTRILAAYKITNESMVSPSGVQYGPENPFLLRGEYRQMNDTEALFHTFVENDDETRTPLTPMDIAFFIRTVSETTSMTDAAIAERLGKNPAWVSQHRALLDLDAHTQALVASGEIKIGTAINVLAKIEPKERKQVIEETKASGASLSSAAVAKTARNRNVPSTKPLRRTDNDVREWFTSKMLKTPDGVAKKFLIAIEEYRAGVFSQEKLDAAWRKLISFVPSED